MTEVAPLPPLPRTLESGDLIAALRRHRSNDVYVHIQDAEPDELARLAVTGVSYHPDSDTIVIAAARRYR